MQHFISTIVLACKAAGDCPSTNICQDGMCHMTCTSDADCAGSLICLSAGVCGIPCESLEKCPQGTTCLNGRCEKTVM